KTSRALLFQLHQRSTPSSRKRPMRLGSGGSPAYRSITAEVTLVRRGRSTAQNDRHRDTEADRHRDSEMDATETRRWMPQRHGAKRRRTSFLYNAVPSLWKTLGASVAGVLCGLCGDALVT